MKDLFADDNIIQNNEKPFPHKRECLYCHKWFVTSSNYANRCPDHNDKPERKQIIIQQDKPF